MGIFADAADKLIAEDKAAGRVHPPLPPMPEMPITPAPVYRFALKDGREYAAEYLAGRCGSGAEGGGGWLYHAVVVGKNVALCGAKPGSWRSAGFARPHPHKEAEITCARCLVKIEKMKT
jgi:hypothetical protein